MFFKTPMSTIEVKVPDIGDFKDVPVIEVFVKPGDAVKAEDSLVTLESDKATMDVPAPAAGTVKDLRIKVGDKVSEGSVLLTLEADGASTAKAAPTPAPQPSSAGEAGKGPASSQPDRGKPSDVAQNRPVESRASAPASGGGGVTTVKVPDIGDFKDVPVIEIFVKPGDSVKPEDALVTLESDKATMDVPAPSAGVVKELKVKVGDKVSEDSVILTLEAAGAATKAEEKPEAAAPTSTPQPSPAQQPARGEAREARPEAAAPVDREAFKAAHASPSVRAFARELGVDLAKLRGTGPKERILQEDVQRYVKQALSSAPAGGAATGAALGLLPWPQIDFTKFGAIEAKPLSRIKKISGANLHRNWVMIPHVTNCDDADITELEAFRVQTNKENEKSGIKVTMLAFLIKACVAALKKFPDFNASLDGDNLVLKQYYHIGFAADTPSGLVVPVIKNADQKGLLAIAQEMAGLSAKA